MKILKNVLNKVNGLRFIIELTQTNSSIGRKRMLAQTFITNKSTLNNELFSLSEVIEAIKDENIKDNIEQIKHNLSQLNDIQGSINNIKQKQTLDDIELFEIKRFSILVNNIRVNILKTNITNILIPDLNRAIDILDPDKKRVPHFYIYSSYDTTLAKLRKDYKEIIAIDKDKAEIIRHQCVTIEDKIRKRLSKQLFKIVDDLQQSIINIAYFDFAIAKAELAIKFNLVKPSISETVTTYNELINPEINYVLKQKNRDFQPINITLYKEPCLITGANMSGKTVLLKTIALVQYLFQFGFYIPAKQASISIVDEVILGINDDQSELSGLSSFAAEMININEIIKLSKNKIEVLALVDELARTTNPNEGIAIVNATILLFNNLKIMSLLTTHYSVIATKCRKLRVKGLKFDEINNDISLDNINFFMDYSLSEDKSDEAPMEALRIAEILQIDNELITMARNYIK